MEINKDIRVAIVGLGYVGLPLLYSFLKKHINAIGIDINEKTISNLKNGKTTIIDGSEDEISSALKDKISSNYEDIADRNYVILCLPTPVDEDKNPIMDYIDSSLTDIKKYIQDNTLISLESTVYPGATREYAEKHFPTELGKSIFICYSPEREDPGNEDFTLETIPKIISGICPISLEMAKKCYSLVCNNLIYANTLEEAESAKLLENIYRAVNIGLINEMKLILDKFDIDVFNVVNLAATKPFGFQKFYPGPGVGGHCIPVDPHYLTWKASLYDIETKMINLADQINESMGNFLFEKIQSSLVKLNKDPKECSLLVLGTSYKKNIADLRESPSVNIIKKMIGNFRELEIIDPFLDETSAEIISDNLNFKNEINYTKKYDLIVILTDHDIFNYEKLGDMCSYIIDTRGRFTEENEKVIRA
tara:strand:- start:12960 stop:14222 length:1263 start_codon:yes stop_codon:yes gene_type:complete